MLPMRLRMDTTIMSKNGDVVWANGASWQRDNEWESLAKQWWIAPAIDGLDGHKTLKELKEFKDFEWIVKKVLRFFTPAATGSSR